MKKFTIYLFIGLLTGIWTQGHSQQTLSETFIINGGNYSNPDEHVAVNYYNHTDEEYQLVDSIYTQATQDALIDANCLYVCAADSLISYDLESMSRIAGIELSGLNQLAVYNDKLLVSRQYPVTTESFKILDKNTLEILETIELSGEAAGIQVYMDSAYVAVPGAWGTEEGRMAVVDLMDMELSREINFGAEAQGLKELFLQGNMIYTVNTNFSSTAENSFSVSEFNVLSDETETTTISGDYYGYYGNSVMAGSKIYIPVSASIARYDVTTHETDFDFIEVTPAAVAYDAVNEQLHITTSDYSTYGEYSIYNMNGEQIQDPISVGVSPEAMTHYYEINNAFSFSDVDFWIGEGDNEALLVIDWNDGNEPVSMAWGYRFDGNVTAEAMMEAISETDANLDIAIAGGFLNDIVYDGSLVSHSGIGGDPDYWSTWSRTNESLWQMNNGISEVVSNGDRFGCSYGFNPSATAPDIPVAAPEFVTGFDDALNAQTRVFSSMNRIIAESDKQIKNVMIFDASGRLLTSRKVDNHYNVQISVKGNQRVVIARIITAGNEIFTEKLILK